MPAKKVRRIGGMPWWYIRKKIVIPVFLLLALVVGVIVMFSIVKSKRLSYIPRANEQCADGTEVGKTTLYTNDTTVICCPSGSNGIKYPHFEEGAECESGLSVAKSNQSDQMAEPSGPAPSNTTNVLSPSSTVRLMLLGDSLIGGGGVPQALKERVTQVFPEIDFVFVGTKSTGGVAHEGHGSFKASDIARDLQDGRWNELNGTESLVNLGESRPDVVIVQLGTNNISSGVGYDKNAYANIFSVLRSVNPQVKIIVSKVPYMFDINSWGIRFSWETEEYNKQLQTDMLSLSTAESPVLLTGYSNFVATDVSVADGVHPAYRGGGEVKLVTNYVNLLEGLFGKRVQL